MTAYSRLTSIAHLHCRDDIICIVLDGIGHGGIGVGEGACSHTDKTGVVMQVLTPVINSTRLACCS